MIKLDFHNKLYQSDMLRDVTNKTIKCSQCGKPLNYLDYFTSDNNICSKCIKANYKKATK